MLRERLVLVFCLHLQFAAHKQIFFLYFSFAWYIFLDLSLICILDFRLVKGFEFFRSVMLNFRSSFWRLQLPEGGTILWLSVQETGRGLVFRGRKILKVERAPVARCSTRKRQ